MKKAKENHPKKETKSNKERAKLHRVRKKKYIEEMQEKVKDLETEVLSLKEENIRLNAIISEFEQGKTSDSKVEEKPQMHHHESFAFFDLPKMLKKEPENVRFTMIDQAFDFIDDFNEERVNHIKNAFDIIINDTISNASKAMYACFKDLDIKEWGKKLLGK